MNIDYLYNMDFNHSYAHGKMTLFKEVLESGEVSYWFNTLETIDGSDTFTAIKLNTQQLKELSDSINIELAK